MSYVKLLLSPLSMVAVYFVVLLVVLVVLIAAHLLQWGINKLTGGKAKLVDRLQSRADQAFSRRPAEALTAVALPVYGWFASLPLVMARELGEDGAPLWLAQGCAGVALAGAMAMFYGALWMNDVAGQRRSVATIVVGAVTAGAYLGLLVEPDLAIRWARLWKGFAWAGLEMMLDGS